MVTDKQTEYSHLYDTITEDLYINYSFPLDSFQKSAIYSLHTQPEDILVTAQTSAGKTIIAEYAISVVLSTQDASEESRIVYTSPIKSLSNQKFSDFRKLFGAENVGIITGDVSINERAPCLIMTTEILRNMLYINHDMVPSIKTVIFDEVHYITDKSRGVVWEESMILLPKHVKLILLSATINNKKHFIDWIVNIRKNTLFNASTHKRPVDLDFYIWFNNNNYIFKSTSNKLFSDDKVHSIYTQRCKCDEVLRKIESKLDPKFLNKPKSQNEMLKFLSFNFSQRNLAPLLIFCFSQKKVENIASLIVSSGQLSLINNQTKKQIKMVIDTVLLKLKEEDKVLPQVTLVKEYLLNGIGIHHSGLLPILKEVTEMLFKWKLIQIIIATETFGMGVNYPAKTVIFDGLFKHDGIQLRGLTANECKQMCGRAGRRGKDTLGEIYIIYNKERKIDREIIKTAFFGTSEEMESQFKVSYTMVLNTINKFGKSFSKFANQSLKQYELIKHYNNRNKQLNNINHTLEDNKDLLDFCKLYKVYTNKLTQFNYLFINSRYATKFISKGNLFYTLNSDHLPVIGVILETNKTQGFKVIYFDLLGKFERIEITNLTERGVHDLTKIVKGNNKFTVCTVKSKMIHCLIEKKIDVGDVSHLQKINYKNLNTFISNLNSEDNIKQLLFTDINVKKLKIKDIKLVMLNEEVFKLNNRLKAHSIYKNNDKFRFLFPIQINKKNDGDTLSIGEFIEMDKQRNNLKEQLDIENTQLNNDYVIKFNELIKLGYIEDGDEPVLSIKGRFSVLLKSCENQVWLTELIFDGLFNELIEEEVVAMISMFYYSKGQNEMKHFGLINVPTIVNKFNEDIIDKEETEIENLNIRGEQNKIESEKRIYEFLERFGELIEKSKIKLNEANENIYNKDEDAAINKNKYLWLDRGFKTGAINAVYWWMKKQHLSTIVDRFDINEGSLTRILNRINYLLEELTVACETVIKNDKLMEKFKKCQEILKRDIMFVESLYFDQGFDEINL
eukprot:GAHX01002464.1.p1 GENE.GAHX01002464.1~~GAHX01002464.1.p1  ORF type:complete len:1015 (-),score=217.59 GAHX01002464.1:24-3068(-)